MKIKIKVTKDILEKSKMCVKDSFVGINCAIALAVREIFPMSFTDIDKIYVCATPESYIELLGTGANKHNTDPIMVVSKRLGAAIIDLPADATQFIYTFDSLSPEYRTLITPISFEIELPEKIIDSVGISSVYKILSESKTLEMVME